MSRGTVPESIGRYRPLAVLGTGAMGTVYRAQDPVIGRMVAIKVVRTEALDEAMRGQLRRALPAGGAGRRPLLPPCHRRRA